MYVKCLKEYLRFSLVCQRAPVGLHAAKQFVVFIRDTYL